MNINRNRRALTNEPVEAVRLVDEQGQVREYVLLVKNIRAHIYPRGLSLAPEEKWTKDYFNRTAHNGRAREAHL